MAGKIQIVIEVDDKGTAKIKAFGDESKKAFEEMKKGPAQVQGPLNSLKEGWIELTAKVAVATAAIYGVSKAISSLKSLASLGSDIERTANVLGMTISEWQRLSYAAKIADVDTSNLRMGMRQLTKAMDEARIGTGDGAKAFSAMGISATDSTGNLKSLDLMLREMADRFRGYKDGPEKLALAYAVFGRSAEAMIPLLNKGGKEIEDLGKKADKLGLTKEDLIKKLAASEEAFKNLEFAITGLKLSAAPVVEEFSRLVDGLTNRLLKFNETAEDFGVIWRGIMRMLEDLGIKGGYTPNEAEYQAMRAKEKWSRQFEIGPELARGAFQPKLTAPKLVPEKQANGKGEDILSAWDAFIKKADEYGEVVMAQQELMELGWKKQAEEIKRLTSEQKMDEWIDTLGEAWGEAAFKARLYEEAVEEAIDANQMAIPELLKMPNELQAAWDSLSKNIGDVWANNVSNMIKGAQSGKEALDNIWKGMADAFISAVTKMITQWLIFGSITGKKESGGGWLSGGFWSGLLGSLFHGGGIVGADNGPTRLMPAWNFNNAPRLHGGLRPDEYPAILQRGEGVFTQGQMKAMGRNENYYYIDARGSQKGVSSEIMRAIKASENRAVIRSVNRVAESKLRGGKFAKIFKD
ncbi:MAG: hypothetical protein FJ115_02065 [Deltaproteobacteria bacterium]|nr:hypothetical protein [Deltaproteobacteria bacterium]MBM4322321.1 hypothetical protein [Deltaproteobacteria bacterium]